MQRQRKPLPLLRRLQPIYAKPDAQIISGLQFAESKANNEGSKIKNVHPAFANHPIDKTSLHAGTGKGLQHSAAF